MRSSHSGHSRVVTHLLVAVRFPPTREGCCTKSTGRRPEYRASFQVSLQYVRSWYVFGRILPMFWFFGSLQLPAVTSAIPGLNSDLDVRFLPAVTSASEVLTQTYRSSGLVRCWAQKTKVREEQSYMSACRIVRLCRTKSLTKKERSRRSRFCTS